MPLPAEPGRPARRLLGRGPGTPGKAPEAPAERAGRPGPGEDPQGTSAAPDAPTERRDGPPEPGEGRYADGPGGTSGPEPAPADVLAASHPAGNSATATVAGAPASTNPAGDATAVTAARTPRAASPAGSGAPGPAADDSEAAGTAAGEAAARGAAASGNPGGSGVAVVPASAAPAGGTGESATDGFAAGDPAGAPDPAGPAGGDGRFTLRLANFEGPFDLLLQLISRHKLDVTEVALSKVTDEFMAHIRAMGPDWDLDQTTEFLVVAATLLDLKAARLLPAAEVEDEADLALLEARDLLFARLLQYRAYKQIATIFEDRAEAEGRRYPRTVGLEPHHADLLPEVVITIGPEGFARLAVKAMQPKAKPQVYVDHIHAPLVSVREQAALVVRLLKARGEATFQELTEDAGDTLTVVARFLALLELYREKAVVLDQEEALKTLTVRWSGGDGDGMPTVTDEFDRIVEAKE
ncbi:segregation and condensation protein A [Streptomyces subrutilus]|uniref:Segregation and condensation protein A n=1 Tax=Streptomyces subrutilus TaxID=36818 RepID=A0A1E5PP89_9ACTN|nr:segregation/condensation protein A [Streptomyces subrutilus]OEJ31365.1 chromosome segregation protein ScpA [Streptomyces subrutilus]